MVALTSALELAKAQKVASDTHVQVYREILQQVVRPSTDEELDRGMRVANLLLGDDDGEEESEDDDNTS